MFHIKPRIIHGVLVTALLSGAGVGCQSRVVSERDQLVQQNLELQNQLDEARRAREAQAALNMPMPQPTPAAPAAAIVPKAELAPVAEPAPVTNAPAPKPDMGGLEVTQDLAAGTTTVNLPSDVFFASGAAMLLPESKKSLSKVISALKKDYAGKPIRIEGYTDSDPIRKSHWKNNQELSEKRAEAVRDYLVSKGIDASRFSTEGLGDSKPKSKSDKAKNRRVELVVLSR